MDIITVTRPENESILDGVVPINETDPSYALVVSIDSAYASPLSDSDHTTENGSPPEGAIDG